MPGGAAKSHALHGVRAQPAKAAKPKHAKTTRAAGASKEEKEVRKWQEEKAEVYRKQAHANMQRARDHAQKAEQEHFARQRRAGAVKK